MGFDRLPNRSRVRSEKESSHVDAVARQRELRTDGLPTFEGLGAVGLGAQRRNVRSNRAGSDQQACADQKHSPIHIVPLLFRLPCLEKKADRAVMYDGIPRAWRRDQTLAASACCNVGGWPSANRTRASYTRRTTSLSSRTLADRNFNFV